ncbi:MAG TPA: hypothetical protein GX401_05730 [Clostridiales bacterium]|nr:hypothetical protein [Clostridiales bacterium]
MNNNYYSPNNNENQQEQEAFSPSQKKKIKFLIVMLDIFSIITMWLFAYQLGGFSDSEFTFKNPVIIIANMVCIVLSVVIITKSIHWFDSQPLMAVLIITLLMLSMALMIVMAFFVPISFIYIIPAVIILGLLLLLLICINTSNYKKYFW